MIYSIASGHLQAQRENIFSKFEKNFSVSKLLKETTSLLFLVSMHTIKLAPFQRNYLFSMYKFCPSILVNFKMFS